MTPNAASRALDSLKRLPVAVKLIAASLAVVLLASVAAALFFTSSPAFFSRYRGLSREYTAMQTSAHKGISCRDCHGSSQGAVVYQVGLVGDFYRSLFTKDRVPVFVKFAPPTKAACLKCHASDWSYETARTSRIPHPAHLRVATETRDCVKCHKWTAHQEAYKEKHKSMPFSGVCVAFGCHVGWKQPQQCVGCHHSLQETGDWKQVHPQVVRASGANSCLERCHEVTQCRQCHTTGVTPKFTGPAEATGVSAIEALHVRPDWISLHGGQALADPSKCQVCHISQTECQNCHAQRPAFHGSTTTWIGQHKTFGTDKKRCLTCHKESWCTWCHNQFKEMQ